MSSSPSDLRLFGLDLRQVGQDIGRLWHDMPELPALAWLSPAVPVRLQGQGGSISYWLGHTAPLATPSESEKTKAERFTAVELPEAMVLLRQLKLPALPHSQTRAAVALQAQTLSPFASADLVWGYSAREAAQGATQITLALASRQQIDTYLQGLSPATPAGTAPEVWALPSGQTPIVLPGYGEQRRQQHLRKWRRVGFGMLGTALLLVAAIVLTPTVQLHQRADQAQEAYAKLRQQTQPLTEQREELVKTSERLAALREIVAANPDPIRVLDLLTQTLPDDTTLLGLQLQGHKVTMNGQTNNAAELMQLLSAHPGIKEVRAPSAATRPLGVNKDSFSLEFVLDAQALAQADEAKSGASAPAASAAPTAPSASAPVASAAPTAPTASAPVAGAASTAPAAVKPAASAGKSAP